LNLPTLCSEEFYDDPDLIFEYAKTLEYGRDPLGTWPGLRSYRIDMINPDLQQIFVDKIFSFFYDLDTVNISADVVSYFQVIPPYSEDKFSAKNQGWIHKDEQVDYAGIIYLTPGSDLDMGTSIFRQKTEDLHLDYSIKRRLYLGEDIKDEEYESSMNDHRSQFEEITRFNNVYNRLIAFNSTNWHAANCFKSNGEHPRLTQVFFIKDIEVT
jgi:hypothetical protein